MLYQLFLNQFKRIRSMTARQYVQIDGPFEKYGYILKHQDNGTYLIRGTGNQKPH
jgi:hypothetical protein